MDGQDNSYTIDNAPINIDDGPRFPWRGVLIDSARHFLTVSAIKTKSGVAYGSVTPTSLPATEGTNTIPTSGLYLMDMDVASTLWTNWFKLRVEIFDASNLL